MSDRLALLASMLFGLGCGPVGITASSPDITLIICDDCSPEQFEHYGHPKAAATPAISQLAADGVTFTHAYNAPICAPGRGNVLLGAQPRYHASATDESVSYQLERSLPNQLNRRGYRSVALGKWHLGAYDRRTDQAIPLDPTHPRRSGFHHYEGIWSNIRKEDGYSYSRWRKTLADGSTEIVTKYSTTDTADDAIQQIDATSADRPLFLWLAFQSIHEPVHTPPQSLVRTRINGNETHEEQIGLMLEALDTEVGRVLQHHRSARADRPHVVIFLGDNGMTPEAAVRYRGIVEDKWKGSGYDGSARVPLVISSSGVIDRGGVSEALINGTDVYGLILDLAGQTAPAGTDAPSFARCLSNAACEHRRVQFAERRPHGKHIWTARNRDYILLRDRLAAVHLFHLPTDPAQTRNLLGSRLPDEAQASYALLRTEVDHRLSDRNE